MHIAFFEGGDTVSDEKRNSTESPENVSAAKDPSRRRFMKNTGMVVGGVAGGSILGGLFTREFGSNQSNNSNAPSSEAKSPSPARARLYFTRFSDFVVLEQATERIYPENDNGPGAIGLDVPYFIDKQLAGDYGSNRKDYMDGPLRPVSNVDTYQTLMNRGEVFIEGLRKINSESEDRHGERFENIDGEQQDAILQDFEDDKIEMEGVRSRIFFNLLLQMTIEGAYSDPVYGGNKDMQGWKMKEHPGIRASYVDLIDSEEFQKLDPVSLTDYQPSSKQGKS